MPAAGGGGPSFTQSLGRISGPLLASNLRRDGQDLWFADTDLTTPLLYLDVNNGRIGVNTGSPTRDLLVDTITNLQDDLQVDTQLDIAKLTFLGHEISILTGQTGNITISPNQSVDPEIITTRIGTENLRISDKLIENITLNSNINFTANGTGQVRFTTTKVNVDGNLHATGDITFDGDVTFGSNADDNVEFGADVNSHIIPNTHDTYDLGSALKQWREIYVDTFNIENTSVGNLSVIQTLLSKGSNNFTGSTHTFGEDSSVNITFNSTINSSLIPSQTDFYTLGTNIGPYRWNTGYFNELNIDSITNIQNNTVTTLTTDTDLELSASGTGKVHVTTANVQIDNNLTVDGTLTVNSDSVSDITYSGLSWGSSFPYTWISIFSLNTAAWTWAESLQSGDVFSIVNNNGDTITVTVDYVSLSGTVGGYADIHVVESIGMASYPSASNTLIVVTRQTPGTTSLKNVEIVGTTTITGVLNQTGNTFITGTFANANLLGVGATSYLQVTSIKLDGSEISATVTNSDLVFTGETTGGVILDEKLKIVDSTISNVWTSPTTEAQQSIFLTPDGTGLPVINTTKSLVLPLGTSATRNLSTVAELRYNTDSNLVEGYVPSGRFNLNNLYDGDRNTYITPELTSGASDDTLRFGVNGTVKATITPTSLTANTMYVDDVGINGNTIAPITTSNDLTFLPSGTGSLDVNSVLFKDSAITNTTTGALVFSSTGAGYVKFMGSGAVAIPYGNNAARPTGAETGELRYSTEEGYLEVYDGINWIPSSGTSLAASEEEVAEIMNLWAIILG